MESGKQIIEDVRMWANEYHVSNPSVAAKSAAQGLADIHKDLPEIVGLSSDILRKVGVEASMSRATSRRLADAVVRETIHADKEDLSKTERHEVVRRSLINVFIQEAAGHEIERRGGIDPTRKLDRDPDVRGYGALATTTLRRVGVDVGELFGSMTEHDLAKTSQGAYDKVSLIAHKPLAKALETDSEIMNKTQAQMNRAINPQERERSMSIPQLSNHPLRHMAPPMPRARPTFGRRMAHVQAMVSGAAM